MRIKGKKMKVSKKEKVFFKRMKNKPIKEVVRLYKKIGFPFRKKSNIKSNYYKYK